MIQNGKIESFAHYSQFSTLKEFNQHMYLWLNNHPDTFTKSEQLALNRLSRYAAKVIGVANVRVGTVLKVIHDEYGQHGISRSTFKRMLKKAKEIQLLKTIELSRKDGSQSSNLYIFQPYPTHMEKHEILPTIGPPKSEKLNHHKTISFKTNQINVLNKRIETLDHTYTNDSIPIPFRDLVKCYYDDAATIEEYWKMANIAAYKYLFEHEDDLKLIIAISAFKQLINAVKRKKINNPIAYYYAILINKYRESFFEKLDELSSVVPVEKYEGIFY